MGFYDCRCLVSGVSLKGADTALVLLQQTGDAYRPLAPAIQGSYNRLGAIDNIDEDANTELVLALFQARLAAGDFVIDEESFRIAGNYPIEDVEQLLWGFERNINDYNRTAVLNGQPVVFALICRAAWDTLARAFSPGKGSATAWFRQLFEGVPAAEEIYRGSLKEVSMHLRELVAVGNFLAERGLAWKPADDPGQDYPEEMRQYLAEARQTFSDSPVLLDALKRYEHEVRDLLQDD
jgi:hypothetical protein